MNNEANFDEYTCKVPRTDRDGNDITGHRLEPGGRRRDSGTLSAMAYDFEPVERANQTEAGPDQPDPSAASNQEIAAYFLVAAGTIAILKVAPHVRSLWDNKAFPRIKKQLEGRMKAHPADEADASGDGTRVKITQAPTDAGSEVTAPGMVSAAGSRPTKVATS